MTSRWIPLMLAALMIAPATLVAGASSAEPSLSCSGLPGEQGIDRDPRGSLVLLVIGQGGSVGLCDIATGVAHLDAEAGGGGVPFVVLLLKEGQVETAGLGCGGTLLLPIDASGDMAPESPVAGDVLMAGPQAGAAPPATEPSSCREPDDDSDVPCLDACPRMTTPFDSNRLVAGNGAAAGLLGLLALLGPGSCKADHVQTHCRHHGRYCAVWAWNRCL